MTLRCTGVRRRFFVMSVQKIKKVQQQKVHILRCFGGGGDECGEWLKDSKIIKLYYFNSFFLYFWDNGDFVLLSVYLFVVQYDEFLCA